MTNSASLDAYANIAGLWIDQRLLGQLEFSRTDCLNGSISHLGVGHFSLPTVSTQRTSADAAIFT
jgi:hypothetical protein